MDMDMEESSSSPFGFGGEPFLAVNVPDPSKEAQTLTRQLQFLLVAIFFLAPAILGRFCRQDPQRWIAHVNFLGFLTACALIVASPVHLFAARSVVVAPALTRTECQSLLQRGQEAAARNLQRHFKNATTMELQTPPVGWRKSRHERYPTTDLNLVTDAFVEDDRIFLGRLLDTRLAPLIQRVWGIPPSAVRANDIFLVRYDAQQQAALAPHTDENYLSFNILLNDPTTTTSTTTTATPPSPSASTTATHFVGGGTRFHKRRQTSSNNPYVDVHPSSAGQVILSNAVLRHEGLPTTAGTRYILVGFLSIDRITPMGRQATGLSWFASWLYLPWVQVTMKQGYKAMGHEQHDNNFAFAHYYWYKGMAALLEFVGDTVAPHTVHELVHGKNDTPYLLSLDAAAARAPLSSRRANWFQHQRLILDASGRVVKQVGVDENKETIRHNSRGEL